MRLSLLLSAALLAGCASDPLSPRADAPVCRAEVNNDPTVRELTAQSAGSPSNFALINKQELADARRQAELNCMRAKGLLPPGGVEPIKPVWYKPLF
jgi:hypothetical protein